MKASQNIHIYPYPYPHTFTESLKSAGVLRTRYGWRSLFKHIHHFCFFPDPCVPQNLAASVNCDMKVVSLSWDTSNGTKLYMVSAEAGNMSAGLTTNVTTAHFSDFTCGQNYSLTVTPHSQHCPGKSSAPAVVQTCRLYTSDMDSCQIVTYSLALKTNRWRNYWSIMSSNLCAFSLRAMSTRRSLYHAGLSLWHRHGNLAGQ